MVGHGVPGDTRHLGELEEVPDIMEIDIQYQLSTNFTNSGNLPCQNNNLNSITTTIFLSLENDPPAANELMSLVPQQI